MAPTKRPLGDRFWSKVERGDGCWLWTASRGRKGYGQLWSGHTFMRATHVSWELHFGPVPDGMWVLHRCDNPPCVRPDHLYLGTAKDNARDRRERNRAGHFGPRKLTWEQAEEIRRRRAEGVPLRLLSVEYGVSEVAVHYIVTGKTYRLR